MNWDRFEGSWNQTKVKIRGKWTKLTSDDLDAIHGRRDLLESTIERRYGFAPDYVRKEVAIDFVGRIVARHTSPRRY